jgi:hypothetical protein
VSGQIPSLIRSIALVVATLPVLGMSIGTPVDAAHADDCLAAPNSPSPQGRHWYHRLDWETQRKCWYLRAPGHHSVSAPSRSTPAADSAPRPVRSADADSASSDVKVVAVNPTTAPTTTSTGDKQRGAIAAPALELPPLQNSSSRSRDQAAESAAAVVTWPDPPSVVATSNDAERTSALSGEPSNNSKTPMMTIFPILALGLAVAAILARFVKDAAARRALVTVNHPELNLVDDQSQHEWRGDQGENESVDERCSLVSALSDQGLLGSENVSFQIAYEISERKDKLARLHQNLDRLLQSPTPA